MHQPDAIRSPTSEVAGGSLGFSILRLEMLAGTIVGQADWTSAICPEYLKVAERMDGYLLDLTQGARFYRAFYRIPQS